MRTAKAKLLAVRALTINAFSEIKGKGFFHLLSSNFLVQLVTYGSQILLAGFLLPEELSRVKTLQIVTDIAVIFAGAGIPIVFLSNFSRKKDENSRVEYFAQSLKVIFVTTSIVFVVFQVLAFLGLLSADLLTNEYFKIYLITIFLLTLNNLFTSYYQGQIQFKKLSSIQLISKTLSLPFILYCTYIYHTEGYIYSLLISLLVSNIWLFYGTKVTPSLVLKLKLKKKTVHHLLQGSSYSFLSQLVGQGGIYLSFLILNYFTTDRTEFGYYAFSLTLIQGLQIFVTSFQQFVIPNFSSASGTDLGQAHKMLKRFEYFYFLTSGGLVLAAYFVAPLAISYFFPEYEGAWIYINLMLLAWGIRSFSSLRGAALIGKGLFKTNFITSAVNLLFAIPLSYFLINNYLVLGAAYAGILQAVIAAVTVNLAYHLKIRKAIYA